MGDTMLIVGAGTMGLLLLQLALRGGASRVAMMDLNEQRLATASKFGGQIAPATSIDELSEVEPLGFDCVIDATGVSRAIKSAFKRSSVGGKFMVFGVVSTGG